MTIINDLWTLSDGKLCTELSTLEANKVAWKSPHSMVITMPDATEVTIKDFECWRGMGDEGHWEFRHDESTWIIFND